MEQTTGLLRTAGVPLGVMKVTSTCRETRITSVVLQPPPAIQPFDLESSNTWNNYLTVTHKMIMIVVKELLIAILCHYIITI
jgi:hypothetical protein